MKQIKSSKTRELSSLDDWALLKVLDQVPLADLIRLGQVNHRFNQLVKRSCRQLVRRHLVLVIGSERTSNGVDQHLNSITLKQLNLTTIEAILVLLPRTVSLKIIYHNVALDEMIYRLEGWVDQLIALELVLTDTIRSELALVPLYGLLNRMSQLKQLHFNYEAYLGDPTTLHLPIIRQLEVFTFKASDGGPLVLKQIRLYATSTLTEINLFIRYLCHRAVDQLLEMPPHLAILFKELFVDVTIIHFHQFVALCEKYPTLTKLAIDVPLNRIVSLNRTLVMLSKLTHLTLYADFAIFHNSFKGVESVDSWQLVPLPSVTTLKLRLYLSKDDDLARLHLGVVFPSVVKLNLDLIECWRCKYKWNDDDLKVKRHCLMQHLQAKGTFGQLLPKLHSVIFCGQIVPEKDWKPKSFVQRTVSFLCQVPKLLYKLALKTFGRVLQL